MKTTKPVTVPVIVYATGKPNGIARRSTCIFSGKDAGPPVVTYHAGYRCAAEGK